MFAEPAARKHLHLSWKMAESLPRSLVLDRVRLRQILANLVGNAVKFTDQGSIELHIRWEDQVPGELLTLLIEVEDTGVGIPPDRLEVIFNPFVQAGAHPDRECQGSGLGLAIVKRLTERMGGSVTVTSGLARGSHFRLRFPDIAISACLPAAEQLMRTVATNFNCLRPATVLGVDDDETNRQLLQAMLSGSHHRLLLASNGREAIEMARQAKPDLILLDVRMPKMDGRQVLQALRKISALELTPVIAITASSLIAEENQIKALFNGCLQKPFSSQDLFNELARFLPQFREAGASVEQSEAPKVPKQVRTPLVLKSTRDELETLPKKTNYALSALTHDLQSSLAGVVMSAELLLEQGMCFNDEDSQRAVMDILGPGRRLLALLKHFSAHRNELSAWPTDDFRAQCGRMQADAQKLRRRMRRRAEARSVHLADNIVRSCTELANFLDRFTDQSNRNKIWKPNCPEITQAAA
jgi:signal transduction histidine kinase